MRKTGILFSQETKNSKTDLLLTKTMEITIVPKDMKTKKQTREAKKIMKRRNILYDRFNIYKNDLRTVCILEAVVLENGIKIHCV